MSDKKTTTHSSMHASRNFINFVQKLTMTWNGELHIYLNFNYRSTCAEMVKFGGRWREFVDWVWKLTFVFVYFEVGISSTSAYLYPQTYFRKSLFEFENEIGWVFIALKQLKIPFTDKKPFEILTYFFQVFSFAVWFS